MADLGSWNFLKFKTDSQQMLSFRDLQLTGSCETENKMSGKAQWVVHKTMKPYELSTTIQLDKRLGTDDVQGTAEKCVQAAREGFSDLFTINGRPIINQLSHPVYFLCTEATVSDIVLMPDGEWLSCNVKMKFKFFHKGGGSSSGSSGGGGGGGGGSSGSKKTSSKSSSKKGGSTGTLLSENAGFQSTKDKAAYDEAVKKNKQLKAAKQAAKKTTDTAKKSSSTAKKSKTPSRAKSVLDQGPTNWAR